MNCLENATKLQTNVVQLLKDPIIQAATCGWKTEISSDGSGKIVEEAIPRGTCAVVRSVKTDTDGKNWFYLGMQIYKKRYTGYMKEDSALSHPDIAH